MSNTTVQSKPASVLIIDDDKVTRMMLNSIIKRAGYTVIQATNGREGFTAFIEHKPDIVLMDVMMPVMDGYATTQAIRNYETDDTTPIIMLTSLEDVESIENAFDQGATDFITKPINWSLLGQRVKFALKASKTEQHLKKSQQLLSDAMKIAQMGYWEWDLTSNQISAPASTFNIMGIPPQKSVPMEQFLSGVIPKDMPLIQQAIAEAQHGMNNIEVSFRIVHHGESIAHIDCLAKTSFDESGKLIQMNGSIQDISRLHKAETLIDYQSNHDKLTDLANRAFFTSTLQTYLAAGDRTDMAAVVIIDLDRFKGINDSLGQAQGDLLLLSVANRLKKVTREEDFVARLGSDEFAVLIKHAKDLPDLNSTLNRVFKDLSAPYLILGQEHFVTFSLGASILGLDGDAANDLISNANVARSKAKQQGGNQYQLYQQNMNEQAKARLMLENDLYKALERNEIEVYYQPQVHADTLQPYGAEALVRWNHSTEGIISPVTFIPIAESTGLIVEIGQFIIAQAIKETEKWHTMGFNDLHIGINLSGRQFSHDNLMEVIQGHLQNTTLPAKYLDLEITESLAMSDADHNIAVLRGLKSLGVSISIDDFGTGYSSLAYLHSFPIDTIKIDRSFILNLGIKEGKAIVNTIMGMAESLNLEVVAEGIEEEHEVAFLQSKNCDIFQGFKFGKPMQAAQFKAYLLSHKD